VYLNNAYLTTIGLSPQLSWEGIMSFQVCYIRLMLVAFDILRFIPASKKLEIWFDPLFNQITFVLLMCSV